MQTDTTTTDSDVTAHATLQSANLDLVMRAGALIHTGFANADEELFASDFVFHYVNPMLADFDGDHHGYEGFRSFFERIQMGSDTGFKNQPHSLTPYGDELVVAYATNTVSFGGTAIDVDAIVVWRIVDGRLREAWDIPAINTVRPHQRRTE